MRSLGYNGLMHTFHIVNFNPSYPEKWFKVCVIDNRTLWYKLGSLRCFFFFLPSRFEYCMKHNLVCSLICNPLPHPALHSFSFFLFFPFLTFFRQIRAPLLSSVSSILKKINPLIIFFPPLKRHIESVEASAICVISIKI